MGSFRRFQPTDGRLYEAPRPRAKATIPAESNQDKGRLGIKPLQFKSIEYFTSLVIEAFDRGIQSIIIGEKTPEQVAAEVQVIKEREMAKRKAK